MDTKQLQYPIGQYEEPTFIAQSLLEEYICDIGSFPNRLRKEVDGLSDEQLDTPYRPGGWTVRQVVNHCADSHMNSMIRFKLALTEDKPTIKPYIEERWAELSDSKTMPIGPALLMLEGLHSRWTTLLRSLTKEELERSLVHPQHEQEIRLDNCIGLYAWHCNHHLAHITVLKKRMGWG